ncbi:MAG: TIGR01212 family radical SAM protein [Thermoguttaceae bacterium]
MASTNSHNSPPLNAQWLKAGLLYHTLNFFYLKKFGKKIRKLSLDAGFNCPNRDGTLATGGCVFCDPESFSPSRRLGLSSITAQLEEGIRRLKARYAAGGFVAYFQPGTNTYAPVDRLRSVFEEALAHPKVVGLVIGTRPDCVPDDVLDLLAELSKRTYLIIEYGLQSIHNRSLDWIKRGHHFQAFLDAYKRSRKRNLLVGVHVILGLPGETSEDMLATARELAGLEIHSVKLHNLYAVRNTLLADMVARGEVELPQFDDYVCRVVDFLELLPPECVIDRLSGDAPTQYLIGPDWCLDKTAVRAAVEAEFRRRGTWQGSGFRVQGSGFGICKEWSIY